jgi:RNA polymerase sigma factor (sigma-70 family)
MKAPLDPQWMIALRSQDLNWIDAHLRPHLLPRLHLLALIHRLPLHQLDDIYQEVLLKLFRFGPRYDSRYPKPLAWIHRLARNALIDMARRENRHLSVSYSCLSRQAPSDDSWELPDSRSWVRWELAEELIRAALDQTPSAEHRAIIQERLRGVPQKQVAQKHNLPTNTVGVVFNRFKKRIVKLLEQDSLGHLGEA